MSFNEYFSEYFSFNEYFSAMILHRRKQEVHTSSHLQSCNSNKTFISQIYIELLVAWEKSLIFSAPGDVKLIATLTTKSKSKSKSNLSHAHSELQNDT